jgi:AcrR family transcriptional regulator
LSIPSHKSSSKNSRPVHLPQRSNGKLRVAAILEAAADVFAEKGYEGATVAEIAARSDTKIGSLYRFFPNKESIADTIVVSARENLDAVFDRFDADVSALSVRTLADDLMAMVLEMFTRPAFMKLLDAGPNWSVKREEFRSALLQRTAQALKIHTPKLSKKSAAEMALVVVLNMKTVASHQAFFNDSAPGASDEFRDMTRLYLQNRLRSSGGMGCQHEPARSSGIQAISVFQAW